VAAVLIMPLERTEMEVRNDDGKHIKLKAIFTLLRDRLVFVV
jgi:hypothetical protein